MRKAAGYERVREGGEVKERVSLTVQRKGKGKRREKKNLRLLTLGIPKTLLSQSAEPTRISLSVREGGEAMA